jgi:hypothetical protein
MADRTFLELLETVEVRVHKTRGTNPERDVAALARDATRAQPEDIARRLGEFVAAFMGDDEFRRRLHERISGSEALQHIFVEYSDWLRRENGLERYSYDQLKEVRDSGPEVEHVLAREPTFDVRGEGSKIWTSTTRLSRGSAIWPSWKAASTAGRARDRLKKMQASRAYIRRVDSTRLVNLLQRFKVKVGS